MCGGNLYNIMLRQELNKKNQVKLKNEQTKINKIAKEHFLIKSMRKFGHMFQTQYVQQNLDHQYTQ
jgi:uncharacterized protein (DUF2344 family)